MSQKTNSGMTPLMFAACEGKANFVEWIMAQEGVDCDAVDNGGNTAYMLAKASNRPDPAVLKLLKPAGSGVCQIL